VNVGNHKMSSYRAEKDILFHNFSIIPTVYPASQELKTDQKYPHPVSQEPNSLLSQEHLYTQIPSLTSGYDHQYESLPALYQLGLHHKDCQELPVWRYQGRSVEELVSYRGQDINNYKKSLSLPILDDINTADCGGESAI